MATSKKDYVAIARILAATSMNANTGGEYDTLAQVAVQLADYFAEDNPLFDRARFLKAAGV